jgi:hypothetical protein
VILVACTALFLVAGIHFFGRRRPAYSHLRHTISELGEQGAADMRGVSWGLFFPVGLALAWTWFTLAPSAPQVAALAAVIAIGYIGAALFPCDPGSPVQGSWRQTLHNIAGGVEYIGGAICLARLGSNQPLFMVLAGVVFVVATLLSAPFAARVRGLAQRVAECCLFGGLLAAMALAAAP